MGEKTEEAKFAAAPIFQFSIIVAVGSWVNFPLLLYSSVDPVYEALMIKVSYAIQVLTLSILIVAEPSANPQDPPDKTKGETRFDWRPQDCFSNPTPSALAVAGDTDGWYWNNTNFFCEAGGFTRLVPPSRDNFPQKNFTFLLKT